jgi:hypothetical protein
LKGDILSTAGVFLLSIWNPVNFLFQVFNFCKIGEILLDGEKRVFQKKISKFFFKQLAKTFTTKKIIG